jgi:hypothetical protein
MNPRTKLIAAGLIGVMIGWLTMCAAVATVAVVYAPTPTPTPTITATRTQAPTQTPTKRPTKTSTPVATACVIELNPKQYPEIHVYAIFTSNGHNISETQCQAVLDVGQVPDVQVERVDEYPTEPEICTVTSGDVTIQIVDENYIFGQAVCDGLTGDVSVQGG